MLSYSTIIAVIAIWLSLTMARNVASSSAFASSHAAYIGSLNANPTFISEVEGLATNPTLLSTLEQIATSIPGPELLTTPPPYLSAIPSSLQPPLKSIHSHQVSLAERQEALESLPSSIAFTSAISESESQMPLAGSASQSSSISTFTTTSQAAITSPSFEPSDANSSKPSQTTTAASSSAPIPTEPPSGGLSSSAGIGIGIGVTIGGLLILILAYMVFRLARRTRQLTAHLDTRRMAEPGIAVSDEPGIAIPDESGVAVSEDKPWGNPR